MNWNLFKQRAQPINVDDYYHVFDIPNGLNILYWNDIFARVDHIEESQILEFGIGRGRSLLSILSTSIYRSLISSNEIDELWVFDSFSGFPEPSSNDISFRNPKKGEWSSSPNNNYKYSPKFLKTLLEKAGYDASYNIDKKLKIFEGFFDKTIPIAKKLNPKIKILHLDGDLFESVSQPLNEFESFLSIGGIIVVDDFNVDEKSTNDPFPGARKAVELFLKTYGNNYKFEKTIRGNPILTKLQ